MICAQYPLSIKFIMLIKKSSKKINQFLAHKAFNILIKLVKKKFISKNSCVVICFSFSWIWSKFTRSNFIWFCIFNYVIYLRLPKFPFIGKFWTFRRKPSYQYYLVWIKPQIMEEVCEVGHKKLWNSFRG